MSMGRIVTLLAPVLAIAEGCREPVREEPETRPAQKTGECRIEQVEGECRLASVIVVDTGVTGGAGGPVLYRLEWTVVLEDGSTRTVDTQHVTAALADGERLKAYYEENSPRPCSAYIVHPPCNPSATTVSTGLDPPPYAESTRF